MRQIARPGVQNPTRNVQLSEQPTSYQNLLDHCPRDGFENRQARNKRIGQFVRGLGHALLVRPMLGLRTRLRHGGDIAVECLPDTRKDPALQQVPRLSRDAEFAAAQASFEQQGSSTVAVTTTAEASAVPKASAAAA